MKISDLYVSPREVLRTVRFLRVARIKGMAGGGEERRVKNPKTGCRPVECQCFTN